MTQLFYIVLPLMAGYRHYNYYIGCCPTAPEDGFRSRWWHENKSLVDTVAQASSRYYRGTGASTEQILLIDPHAVTIT